MPHTVAATATYLERIAFVTELAGQLHAYGTTTQRLEGALIKVSNRLGLHCEPLTNPTGMTLSFSDLHNPHDENEKIRVIRRPPGDTHLGKLCDADRIAEEVMAGRLDLAAGHAALRALEQPSTRLDRVALVLGFGLAAAAIAGLLRLPWPDIATAGGIGLVIGMLELVSSGRPLMREASEALAALVAGFLAILVAAYVVPLNLTTVIIASLIVFVPGMMLTNAVNELTSQQLMSGTARFAGALAILLKLTVGSTLALALAQQVGIEPQIRASRPQPDVVEGIALVLAACSFALLFRAKLRDYPIVVAAAIGGYLVSRIGGEVWGNQAGVFLSALLVTAAGNGYARWARRPGALVRVPGILMLVPGSTSLRGVMAVMQHDTAVGQDAAMGAFNILLALIAGLMFGNLLLPTRRNL